MNPLLGGFAALCLALPVPRAAASDATPGELVAPGVQLLRGEYQPPRQPDGNSVVFAAPEGVVVVDTGRHPAHLQSLLAMIGPRPVRVVVNSHWHLDHVGGNPGLRAAHPGLVVRASPAIDGALGGFLADYRRQLATLLAAPGNEAARPDWRAELERIDAGVALRPDQVIVAGGDVELAGARFRLGLEPHAVTAGDAWLFDPASGVLAAGDLVTLPAPFLDTACPRGWQQALARLDAVPFWRLVPGHGAVMDRPAFARYRAAFDGLLACAAGPAPDADCIEGWVRDAGPLLAEPRAREQARSLLGYYLPTALRGTDAGRHCASPPDPAR